MKVFMFLTTILLSSYSNAATVTNSPPTQQSTEATKLIGLAYKPYLFAPDLNYIWEHYPPHKSELSIDEQVSLSAVAFFSLHDKLSAKKWLGAFFESADANEFFAYLTFTFEHRTFLPAKDLILNAAVHDPRINDPAWIKALENALEANSASAFKILKKISQKNKIEKRLPDFEQLLNRYKRTCPWTFWMQ